MDWLRLYTEILDDEKIAKMTDTQYRIFTYLMLVAREKDQNGSFTYDENDIAWRLRRPKAQINNTTQKLIELEIITIENNILTFINWSKRQYKSDDINARVKRYREKNETLHETLENRTEQIQNRTERKKEKISFDQNHFLNIPDDLKTKWKSIAPGISVDMEITKAEAWVLSNPKLKKSNWSRFLTNWIVRAQDHVVKYGGNGNGFNANSRSFKAGHDPGGLGIPPEYKPEPKIERSPEEVERGKRELKKITDRLAGSKAGI
jgi:hypothetical protein